MTAPEDTGPPNAGKGRPKFTCGSMAKEPA
jgi:hypothetical protein